SRTVAAEGLGNRLERLDRDGPDPGGGQQTRELARPSTELQEGATRSQGQPFVEEPDSSVGEPGPSSLVVGNHSFEREGGWMDASVRRHRQPGTTRGSPRAGARTRGRTPRLSAVRRGAGHRRRSPDAPAGPGATSGRAPGGRTPRSRGTMRGR